MSMTLGSKKLYRVPEEGMVKGVCAGLAHYFDVPVRLIRVMVVLSLFFGLFFLHAGGLYRAGVRVGRSAGQPFRRRASEDAAPAARSAGI